MPPYAGTHMDKHQQINNNKNIAVDQQLGNFFQSRTHRAEMSGCGSALLVSPMLTGRGIISGWQKCPTEQL